MLSKAHAHPESLTPDQIQYILMENKILKELLKNVIHGSVSSSTV
jgi:hypothetical protein